MKFKMAGLTQYVNRPAAGFCPPPPPVMASTLNVLANCSRTSMHRKLPFSGGAPSPAKDVLHEIVSYQSFDGSFKWQDTLIQSLGLTVDVAKQEAEENNWDLNAWATMLAITFFTEKLGEERDSWELVVNKANKWLAKNYSALKDVMVQHATKLIESA